MYAPPAPTVENSSPDTSGTMRTSGQRSESFRAGSRGARLGPWDPG